MTPRPLDLAALHRAQAEAPPPPHPAIRRTEDRVPYVSSATCWEAARHAFASEVAFLASARPLDADALQGSPLDDAAWTRLLELGLADHLSVLWRDPARIAAAWRLAQDHRAGNGWDRDSEDSELILAVGDAGYLLVWLTRYTIH